jgi:hypothetical protein
VVLSTKHLPHLEHRFSFGFHTDWEVPTLYRVTLFEGLEINAVNTQEIDLEAIVDERTDSFGFSIAYDVTGCRSGTEQAVTRSERADR